MLWQEHVRVINRNYFKIMLAICGLFSAHLENIHFQPWKYPFNRGRISSVGRAFNCRAGGRRFDSLGRTITQGLKMTEKWRYSLCTASGETFAWLGWPRKMAVPSPLGDVKIVSPISTFVLNTLTLKWKCILTHLPLNRPCGSTFFLPFVTSSVLTVKDNFVR